MPVIATPGAADANSFGTTTEADDYFAQRLPLATPWIPGGGDVPSMLLIMATRVLTSAFLGQKMLRENKGDKPYYVTGRAWTGSVVDTIQALPWPRKGMYDERGNAISEGGASSIPDRLKWAQFELAGQLGLEDRTLDNAIVTQGLTRLKVDVVELSFREGLQPQVIPDAVLNMLVPSWYTAEVIERAFSPVLEFV